MSSPQNASGAAPLPGRQSWRLTGLPRGGTLPTPPRLASCSPPSFSIPKAKPDLIQSTPAPDQTGQAQTTYVKPAAYVPHLDGLRGVAILLVMVYHFTQGISLRNPFTGVFVDLAAGFFVGVDIFFVVSGFLITRILLAMNLTRRAYLVFTARRVLRIFPPYWFYLIACLALLPALRQYSARSYLNDHWLWFFTYTNNIRIALEGWPASYLSHLWSLAIEEQFYLIWPLVLLLLAMTKLWLPLLGLMVLAPAAARYFLYAKGADPVALYVLLPTRLDPLAIGALIAYCESRGLLRQCHKAMKLLAIPAGLFMLLYLTQRSLDSVSVMSTGLRIAGQHFATGLLTGVLITAGLTRPGVVRRMFTRNWLVKIGTVSYSLYLWHFAVNAIFRNEELHPLYFGRAELPVEVYLLFYIPMAGLISYLIAMLSWKYFEEPILRLKRYFPRPAARPA